MLQGSILGPLLFLVYSNGLPKAVESKALPILFADYTGILLTSPNNIYVVGPCHHGMARPQVADRGTASDKEGSCE